MTTTTYASPIAADFRKPPITLLQWLIGKIRKINAELQARKAEGELMTMTDRSLRDIGLTRSEIPRVVRGQYYL